MTKLAEILVSVRAFWRAQSKSTRGFTIGFLLGAAILLFGFLQTLFLLLCGGLGVIVSVREEWTRDIIARMEDTISRQLSRMRW